jgi:hypothetical protein
MRPLILLALNLVFALLIGSCVAGSATKSPEQLHIISPELTEAFELGPEGYEFTQSLRTATKNASIQRIPQRISRLPVTPPGGRMWDRLASAMTSYIFGCRGL